MKTARFFGVAAVCVLVGTPAFARDLRTVGGTVFKNVSLVTKSATGIQISHDDGLIFLDYRNLNDADRKEFGYDETTYVEGLKQNVEVRKQAQAQAQAAQQARAARIKAEAAEANAWKTHSLTTGAVTVSTYPVVPPSPYGYVPGTGPSTPTGIEYNIEAPGWGYGPYYSPGTIYPTVPQTYYGNGQIPYIRHPYPLYGPTMGPIIIRKR